MPWLLQKKPGFLKKLQQEVRSVIDDVEEYQAAQKLSIEHGKPLSDILYVFSCFPRENPPIKKFEVKGKKIIRVSNLSQ